MNENSTLIGVKKKILFYTACMLEDVHMTESFHFPVDRWQTWMTYFARPRERACSSRSALPPPCVHPSVPPSPFSRLCSCCRASPLRRAVAGWRVHGAGSTVDDAGPMSESNFIFSACWVRRVTLVDPVRGPERESMPINKSNRRPLIYNC